MNSAIAEWCSKHLEKPTKILYLPGGPYEVGKCEVDQYDVIVTRCKIGDLDNKDLMACLWRLGYEFAAPAGVLLLEIDGYEAIHAANDIYPKLSSIGWCQWDRIGAAVSVLQRVQTLAPWLPNESVRMMSPNLISDAEAAAQDAVTPP